MKEYILPIKTLEEHTSPGNEGLLFDQEVTAIHSGKLGDIIYALPTVKQLGINHLLLNVFTSKSDAKRNFSIKAARQLIPLLLNQPYIRKVSVVRASIPMELASDRLPHIDYNLDRFRCVARHRLPDLGWTRNPQTIAYSEDGIPIHLIQMFSAAQCTRVSPREPWIHIDPSPRTSGKVLVSLAPRWRSFPGWYWPSLLAGLRDTEFIGLPSDSLGAEKAIETQDHRELASLIAGSKLFLGTISFPYAIAEGLRIPRLVELCHFNLNAYPIAADDCVLEMDPISAREQIANKLDYPTNHPYRLLTRKLARQPILFLRRHLFLQRAQLKCRWMSQIGRIRYLIQKYRYFRRSRPIST